MAQTPTTQDARTSLDPNIFNSYVPKTPAPKMTALHPDTPQMPDFVQYSKAAARTASYPQDTKFQAVNYLIHLLNSEAGEVAGKFQKLIRDSGNPAEALREPEVLRDLRRECGDALWALAELGRWLGVQYASPVDTDFGGLEQIAEENLSKLLYREERGTISGSGDNR